MIDLHLHTTASDGRSSPEALVREAVRVGVTTMAVTDHDTMAGVPAVRQAAEAAGVAFVPGIEISAVHQGADVHVLAYFVDAQDDTLAAFLADQRRDRRRRLVDMADRLATLGVPVDITPLLARPIDDDRALGRPQLAAALVAAGHAVDVADAFDRYLAAGRPAFLSRHGATPAHVMRLVADAGGIASLAHPAKLGDDLLVEALILAGLPAIEVFHPDHDEAARARYEGCAARHGLLVTGGSDYHGPASGRADHLGAVGLPAPHFARLEAWASRRGRPW